MSRSNISRRSQSLTSMNDQCVFSSLVTDYCRPSMRNRSATKLGVIDKSPQQSLITYAWIYIPAFRLSHISMFILLPSKINRYSFQIHCTALFQSETSNFVECTVSQSVPSLWVCGGSGHSV